VPAGRALLHLNHSTASPSVISHLATAMLERVYFTAVFAQEFIIRANATLRIEAGIDILQANRIHMNRAGGLSRRAGSSGCIADRSEQNAA
jgi:hypothetical protein